ncbi:MAG: glycine cleavage T C-terminal barrel domain-containing protein [Acidimicrobiales bacterium]|jgi:folate-binding protein YgfZ
MKPALDLHGSYELVKNGACGFVMARDAVIVRGPDARGWLQGQVSQDIAPLCIGGSKETLVLSPQGKVEAYCRVTLLGDEVVLIDTETGYGAGLEQRLRRFKLRVKAELERATLRCLVVRGPGSELALGRGGLELAKLISAGRVETLDDSWAVPAAVSWPGYSGFDLLIANGQLEQLELDVPLGDAAGLEAARIEAGVPAMGRELTEKTIPQEAGELVSHTVSFTKGCFTGQELVARLDARGGNVAWRLRALVLEPVSQARAGAALLAGDRDVGHLTSVTWSPGYAAPVALGYVRRDVTPPFEVTVAPDGTRAVIREIPL